MLKPAFGAHFDHVAKTLRGDQRGFRTAPFDQRIGGQGRAVNDLANVASRDPGLGADLLNTAHNRLFGCGMGGEHLGGTKGRAGLQHDIGESAANVDAKPGRALRHPFFSSSQVWRKIADALHKKKSFVPIRTIIFSYLPAVKAAVRALRLR